ncbi:helix-turn-helix domain-containing protein [Aquabacterium sp.]|uniref:helix-turn-helix domain-containing protein n=1 Tax=Aquabacterium sp. TaxID=1872578 RepID=UPI003D6D66F4
MSVLGKRLDEARKRKGLSQERLGVLAGIDEMSAGARVNQYIKSKHAPDSGTVERLAAVLEVPVPYLYADDDQMAELLLVFHALDPEARNNLLETLSKR